MSVPGLAIHKLASEVDSCEISEFSVAFAMARAVASVADRVSIAFILACCGLF
jgi:hypothetical protein